MESWEYWCDRKDLGVSSSSKNYFMQNLITCNCELNKACEIDKYLDIKNRSCKNDLFGK